MSLEGESLQREDQVFQYLGLQVGCEQDVGCWVLQSRLCFNTKGFVTWHLGSWARQWGRYFHGPQAPCLLWLTEKIRCAFQASDFLKT